MSKEPMKVIQSKRKTKFEPWMCEKIIEVAESGGHVAAMCKEIGIRSRDTFYRWLDEYEEFKKAYESSKLVSQALYEGILLNGAMGKINKFNFNAIAMIMNNKFPDQYTRAVGGSNTNVTIGSINSIEKLDNKQLDDKITKLLSNVNVNGDEHVEEVER